jgi:hypothetical protein
MIRDGRYRPCLESLEHRVNPAALTATLVGPAPAPAPPRIELWDETPLLLPAAPAPLAAPSAPAVLNAMHERSPRFAPFSVDFITAANQTPVPILAAAVPQVVHFHEPTTLFVVAQIDESEEPDVPRGAALFGVGGNADDLTVITRRQALVSDDVEVPVTPKKPIPTDADPEIESTHEQLCA